MLFFLILLSSSAFLYAGQTGKIVGKITDSETKEAIVGASVVIEGTYLGAAADINGNYIIANVPPGEYRLIVSCVGYMKTTVSKVMIKIDLTTTINVAMTMQKVNLTKEVFVTAERPLVQKDLTSTSAIVTSSDIKMMPVESVGQLVNLQAGVVNGHFRGGRSGEVAYLVDGIPVTDVFNGGSGLQVEPSSIRQMEVISGTFNAEYGQAMSGVVNTVTQDGSNKFEVNANAYVGNKFTTHSDIFQNLAKLNRIESRDFQIGISGPTGLSGLTFFTTGRYFKDDGYLYGKRVYNIKDTAHFYKDGPVIPTGDGSFVSMNPEWHNSFNGKLTYSLPGVKISYSFFWNDNHNRYYDHYFSWTPDGIMNHYQKNTVHYLQLTHIPTASTIQSLKVSYNIYDFRGFLYDDMYDANYIDPQKGIPTSGYTFRQGGNDGGRYYRTTTTLLGQYSFSSQLNSHHKIGLGAEAKLHTIFNHSLNIVSQRDEKFVLGYPAEGAIIADKGSNIIYTKYPVEGSAYIQDKIEYDIMIINAGLRFDYFDPHASLPADLRNPTKNTDFPMANVFNKATAKTQISPRLGASFPITDQGIIRFSYGHFFQIPSFERLYTNPGYIVLPGGSLSSVLGNPDLKAQKTVMYEIGLQQVLFNSLTLNLSFYSRDIRNLLGMEIINTYEGFKYARFINRDYGNVRGIILTVEKRLSDFFSAKVDYTYQIAEGNASDPYSVYNNNQTNPPVEESKQVVPLDWDQRHTLNISMNVGRQDDWNVGLIFQYGSGFPYTEDSKVSQGVRFENGGIKPSTFNVDLRADKKFDIYGYTVNAFVLVYNILDIKNEYGVYATTGRANVDLNTKYAGTINGLNTIEQYINNPSMYSGPRDIRLGFGIAF